MEGPAGETPAAVGREGELQAQDGRTVGQIWRLGQHRLAVGDCTDKGVVEGVMGQARAKSVITDPPYGIDKEKIEGDKDLTTWANSIKPTYEVIQNKGFYCCFVSIEKMLDVSDLLKKKLSYKWQIIQYINNGMVRGGVGFSVYIAVLIFCKGDARASHLIRDVRETSNSSQKAEKRVHPYEKDILFVSDIINYSTDENDIVYDPFLGSGTTMIACENLNRKCRGIEIDPGYAAVSIHRWESHTGRQAELVAE